MFASTSTSAKPFMPSPQKLSTRPRYSINSRDNCSGIERVIWFFWQFVIHHERSMTNEGPMTSTFVDTGLTSVICIGLQLYSFFVALSSDAMYSDLADLQRMEMMNPMIIDFLAKER